MLTLRWGVGQGPSTKTVWCEVASRPPAAEPGSTATDRPGGVAVPPATSQRALATDDAFVSWVRFDGMTGEFVHRMPTWRDYPLSTARYFDTHWFQSYKSDEQA